MIDITTQISMTISLLVKAPMHVNDIYPFRVIQLQISSSSFPCDTRATQKQIPPLTSHQKEVAFPPPVTIRVPTPLASLSFAPI